MTQLRPRVSAADGAPARFVERARVGRPRRVLDVEAPARGESLAVAAVARRDDAVEHVDAARDALDQILRRADAHQVSRPLVGHPRRNRLDDLVHDRLLFPDAQTPDGVPVEPDLDRALKTLAPQVKVRRALHDAEERLTPAQALPTM